MEQKEGLTGRGKFWIRLQTEKGWAMTRYFDLDTLNVVMVLSWLVIVTESEKLRKKIWLYLSLFVLLVLKVLIYENRTFL